MQFWLPATPAGLFLLDLSLDIFHAALVLFVLTGWLFRRTVALHFYTVLLVWFSWIGMGLYVGNIGYCALTDWQWQVKYALGSALLPPSFVEYLLRIAWPHDVNDAVLSYVTGGALIALTLISGFRFFAAGWKIKRCET